MNKLKNLNLGNIFFINKKKIEKLINSNSLIESYIVFKEYPSTLNIKIDKTNFFAKINDNGKNYLIGSNGKLLKNESLNVKELLSNVYLKYKICFSTIP